MKYIDTHAHLDFKGFDADRKAVIENLVTQEIGVINIGTTLESNEKVAQLTKDNKLIWAMIGIHPTDITPEIINNLPKIIDDFKALIDSSNQPPRGKRGGVFSHQNKIVGVGEIGLDYYHDRSTESANRQKTALRQFLAFANENNLPATIHCRDAYSDLLTILADYPGIKTVIHCFSGDTDLAKKFLEIGAMLSFTAIITYPGNEIMRQVVKEVPLKRIMLETDSPFLPLKDRRGTRNDPSIIPDIAQFIAEIKKVTVEEVADVTTKNAIAFFGLRENY